ncbi:MAG: hypothetical protein AAF827_21490 [Cyanobacteria bacterium P01_D01_bin.6]
MAISVGSDAKAPRTRKSGEFCIRFPEGQGSRGQNRHPCVRPVRQSYQLETLPRWLLALQVSVKSGRDRESIGHLGQPIAESISILAI